MRRAYRRRRSATVLATCRATSACTHRHYSHFRQTKGKKKKFDKKERRIYPHSTPGILFLRIVDGSRNCGSLLPAVETSEKRKERKIKKEKKTIAPSSIMRQYICEYATDRQAELRGWSHARPMILQSITTIEKRCVRRDPADLSSIRRRDFPRSYIVKHFRVKIRNTKRYIDSRQAKLNIVIVKSISIRSPTYLQRVEIYILAE